MESAIRQLRYGVATSLDGFITGPGGEYDWIVPDPAIDFAALHARFDTLLMGRRTYEVARTRRDSMEGSGQRWIVVSRTLKPEAHPGVTILGSRVPKPPFRKGGKPPRAEISFPHPRCGPTSSAN